MPSSEGHDQWNPHSVAAVIVRQLEAVDLWNACREQREALLLAYPSSRQSQLEARRQVEVFRRAQEALLERTSQALTCPPSSAMLAGPRTAVVAHRHPWFVEKVTEELARRGIAVVATTDNGAVAVGFVVAEQPGLLLVEETLAMLSGPQVLAEAALFASATVRAAHVCDSDGVGRMLDAGARSVWARPASPAEIAEGLLAALDEAARGRPAAPKKHAPLALSRRGRGDTDGQRPEGPFASRRGRPELA